MTRKMTVFGVIFIMMLALTMVLPTNVQAYTISGGTGSGTPPRGGGGVPSGGGTLEVWNVKPRLDVMDNYVTGVRNTKPSVTEANFLANHWREYRYTGSTASIWYMRYGMSDKGAQATTWFQNYVIYPTVNDPLADGVATNQIGIHTAQPRYYWDSTNPLDSRTNSVYINDLNPYIIPNGTWNTWKTKIGWKDSSNGGTNVDSGQKRNMRYFHRFIAGSYTPFMNYWGINYQADRHRHVKFSIYGYSIDPHEVSPYEGGVGPTDPGGAKAHVTSQVFNTNWVTVKGNVRGLTSGYVGYNAGVPTLIFQPGTVINSTSTSAKEGRYSAFGAAVNARGNITRTYAGVPKVATESWVVQRPRVRVEIVDRNGTLIPGATWTLNHANNTYDKNNLVNGSMVGTLYDNGTDVRSDSVALDRADLDAYGGDIVASSLIENGAIVGGSGYNLIVTVPTNYSFENYVVGDTEARYYTLNNLTGSGSVWSSSVNRYYSISADGKTLILKGSSSSDYNVHFGIYNNTYRGGYYTITIKASEIGPELRGSVYRDENNSGVRDNGELGYPGAHQILIYSNGADPRTASPLASANVVNGNYSVRLPGTLSDTDVDVYVKLHTPSGDEYVNLWENYASLETIIDSFTISEPNNMIEDAVSTNHRADIHLPASGSITQNFGVYAPAPVTVNPSPVTWTTPISGPTRWLNSNKEAVFQYTPEINPPAQERDNKILRANLQLAEFWYPANYDWAWARVRSGDKTIQPVYQVVRNTTGSNLTVRPAWRQENAEVKSTVVKLQTQPLTVYTNRSDIINNGRIIYSANDSSKLVIGGYSSGISASYPTQTGIKGSYTLDGGLMYYGVSVYQVTEYDGYGTLLSTYYQFSQVEEKGVKVYDTVGTN